MSLRPNKALEQRGCKVAVMRFSRSVVPLTIVFTLCACGDSRDAKVVAATLEDFGARTDTMSLHEDGITLI